MHDTLYRASIPGLTPVASGKVREIFEVGPTLLIVATDRVSAYDSVMPTPIPMKGAVLTALSRFWFRMLRPYVVTHYITTDTDYILARLAEHGVESSQYLRDRLHGRSMLVVKAEMLPVECVVRGYLSGSLYAEYCSAGGTEHGAHIHGISLPPGLRESDQLPEPLFTPAIKAASGHDQNISFEEAAEIVGAEMAGKLRDTSLTVYKKATEIAASKGIIIADTKFEFGLHNGVLTLADEVLTPDSSRFWDASLYAPGRPQPSFDKQYLRDWLVESGWTKEPPAPALPPDVVAETSRRYVEACVRLTGAGPTQF